MAELQITLKDQKMSESESACSLLNRVRVRAIFMEHQAPFPLTHSTMLTIYVNGTVGLIQFFQTQHNTRLDDMRKSVVKPESYPMRWTEIQEWAGRFDRKSMIKTAKSSSRMPVQDDPNASKTRSGKAYFNALDTDAETPRGRTDQRQQRDQRYKSRSASSNGKPSGYSSDGRRQYQRSGSTTPNGSRIETQDSLYPLPSKGTSRRLPSMGLVLAAKMRGCPVS